ncbi:MAG: acyl--CoA ligase [Phycisphaerae bacterium]|nr:acyl--CoA ligase [Phycisphaerae bacterium]
MVKLEHLNGVPQYALSHFEEDFADRHLLHGVVAKWAKETPDAPALIEVETGNAYTYAQFDRLTTALALKLVDLGFEKGDFLATTLPFLAEHVFVEYACFKIGVIHAPLDIRLKAPEVVRSLGLIKPKGYVFLGKTEFVDFTELGKLVQARCPYIEHFVQLSPPAETIKGALSGISMYQDLGKPSDLTASPAWKRYRELTESVTETDGAQVIYTTGSTGLPKPALLSHRNITAQCMCLGGGFEMLDGGRMLVDLPPSHVGGQAEQLMTPLFAGGTSVLMRMFDPVRSLQAIQDHNVEFFGQIPAMFAMQWRLPNFGDFDFSSLKVAIYGGQQVSREFLRNLSKMAPRSATGLGLTELAGFVTYTPLDVRVEDLDGSIGWDMPITPMSIRKPMKASGAAGEELPDGEVGEICFSGPQVFIGYVNNEDAYRRTVSKEGVCYTGDLGYKGKNGLYFSGRSKLVMKPKGYQVHPAQVEDHFTQLADRIAGCGAVSAPHDVFSEGVVLFVEPKDGKRLTREELDCHAKGIASYMRPLHYIILEPGKMPLNRVAKTDYVALKENALAEVDKLRAQGGWDR